MKVVIVLNKEISKQDKQKDNMKKFISIMESDTITKNEEVFAILMFESIMANKGVYVDVITENDQIIVSMEDDIVEDN